MQRICQIGDGDCFTRFERADVSLGADNAAEAALVGGLVGRVAAALHERAIPTEYRDWEWRYLARLTQSEERRFTGPGFVVAATPLDGRSVYGGYYDRVHVWSLNDGRELPGFSGHTSPVCGIALDLTRKRVASAERNGGVHIWNSETQTLEHRIAFQPGEILQVAFSHDGSLLAVATGSTTEIALFDANTGERSATLRGHTAPVNCLRFLPDGRLISGGQDRVLRSWDVKTGTMLPTAVTLGREIWNVTGPAGGSLWIGDESGMITVVHAKTLQKQKSLQAHSQRTWGLNVSPDGCRVLSGSMDQTAKLWETSTDSSSFRWLGTLRGHTNDVCMTALLPGNRLLTAGDSTIRIFNAENLSESRILAGIGSGGFDRVGFSPDGNTVTGVARNRNTIWLWGAGNGKPVSGWPPLPNDVCCVSFLTNQRLIAGTLGGELWIRTLAGGEGTRWKAGARILTSIPLRDENHLLTLDAFGELARWNVLEQKRMWALKLAKPQRPCLAVANRDIFVIPGPDNSIELRSLQNGVILATLLGHTHTVNDLQFSPDGTLLASASSDATVRLWNVSTRESVRIIRTHSHYVYGVAFSPDGRRFIDASGDRTMTLYDTESGLEILTLRGHPGEVKSVAFSPDGMRIASGSDDGTVRLWDAPFGLAIQIPPETDQPFNPSENAK